jgi:tetratricopeptide (TPR) repeat protein
VGECAGLAAANARGAHAAQLRVDVERLGQPAQRREMLGNGCRRAPGALEPVAVRADRVGRQVLVGGARAQERDKRAVDSGVVRRVSGDRCRAATSAARAARPARSTTPPANAAWSGGSWDNGTSERVAEAPDGRSRPGIALPGRIAISVGFIADRSDRQTDLEARANIAVAVAAVFALLAGSTFVGLVPKTVSVIAGCAAFAALIAVVRFRVEARNAGLELASAEAERARAELERRAPALSVDQVIPTRIGVDAAEQDILPGGEVPAYVARDADGEVRDAVEAALDGSGRWLVVVTGPEKVGKSRSAFEAVREANRHRPLKLIAPENADALRDSIKAMDEPLPSAPHTVLWLDDLEPFFNKDVTLATLDGWRERAGGGIAVGTFGGKGSARIAGAASGGVATIAAEVLQKACRIALTETTPHELAALGTRVSAHQLTTIERHGLAAYLVAGPALETKLFTRRHAPGEPECPEGAAVVYAAVDWARCGRTDPIPKDILRALWPHYLDRGGDATDPVFERARDWACRPVAGTIALLHRADGFQAFDYVVRLVRDRPGAERPPKPAWTAAIRGVGDAQALAIGIAAYGHERFDIAIRAFRRARKSSVDEVVALAGFDLGVVRGDLGRSEDAVRAYEQVVARFGDATEPGLREHVAKALVGKGVSLRALRRFEDELGAYNEVVARFGDATEPALLRELVARALFTRGARLGDLERFEEAVGVYDEVVERFGEASEPAVREQVAFALLGKGLRLGSLERPDEAVGAYDELVARFGDAAEPQLQELAAGALLAKGISLEALARPEEAVGVYDEVVARFGDATEPGLREPVARALAAKSDNLGARGRFEDELNVYDEMVARFGDATEPRLRELVAHALDAKAARLVTLRRFKEAIGIYEEVVTRFDHATEPALRQLVATARRELLRLSDYQ